VPWCKTGLLTWVKGELRRPPGPGDKPQMFHGHARCDACGEDTFTRYRSTKRPSNEPPPGAHFFEKIVGGVSLPFHDPKREPKAPPPPSPPVEMCEGFGYQCAWLAVPSADAASLAKRLLGKPAAASWKDGVAAAYRGSIFVSPRVGEWTFAVSTSFFEHAADPSALLARAGGGAQFFASDRVIGLHVAVKKGKRVKLGDEEKLMKQAGKWGMNPQDLAGIASEGARGWISASLASARRPAPRPPR
jgi:hypothetical protein